MGSKFDRSSAMLCSISFLCDLFAWNKPIAVGRCCEKKKCIFISVAVSMTMVSIVQVIIEFIYSL